MARAQHDGGAVPPVRAPSDVVVALPTAAPEPVQNPKRRGRLPATVATMTRARQARRRMSQARDAIAAKCGRPGLASPADASQTDSDRAELARAALGSDPARQSSEQSLVRMSLQEAADLAAAGQITGYAAVLRIGGEYRAATAGDLTSDPQAVARELMRLAWSATRALDEGDS